MGKSILIIPRQKLFATAARFAMGSFQYKHDIQHDYYNVEIACYGCYQIIQVQMGNSKLIIPRHKLLARAARFAIGSFK